MDDKEPHPYRSRTHSRLLLRSFGWPIKHFLDLSELLHVLHDAVLKVSLTPSMPTTFSQTTCTGHHHAYQNNVLHRDISYGNILANARKSEHNQDLGFPIDFNYGSITEHYEALHDDLRSVVSSIVKHLSFFVVDFDLYDVGYHHFYECRNPYPAIRFPCTRTCYNGGGKERHPTRSCARFRRFFLGSVISVHDPRRSQLQATRATRKNH
jgi:serine/threonine protein kinase